MSVLLVLLRPESFLLEPVTRWRNFLALLLHLRFDFRDYLLHLLRHVRRSGLLALHCLIDHLLPAFQPFLRYRHTRIRMPLMLPPKRLLSRHNNNAT